MFAYILWSALIAGAFGVYIMLTKRQEELAKEIEMKLPDIVSAPEDSRNYATEIAIAAASTKPPDFDILKWVSIIAGVLDRESRFGDALTPPGPAGVGDLGNRWRPGPPKWAVDRGLTTGKSKLRNDGVTVYEIRPPAAGGAVKAGWGYGLGQHDWEMGGLQDWIESGAYANPQQNIMRTATKLAANYRLAKSELEPVAPNEIPSINYAIAMYNAGAGVLSEPNPDTRTTGGDYSSDVLRRAAQYA